MTLEVKVPSSGESISEVFVGEWRKQVGEHVQKGEIIVELETDKVTLEIPAPISGTIESILAEEGDNVAVGAVIAELSEDEGQVESEADPTSPEQTDEAAKPATEAEQGVTVMPAAERLIAQHGLNKDDIKPTGPGNRLLKEDVQRHIQESEQQKQQQHTETMPSVADEPQQTEPTAPSQANERETNIVRMSPIRMRIAERLVEAQQTAALLTTINEIDMTEVIALRAAHQEEFQKKYGVKLGFMSFFVKATVVALQEFPAVNAYITSDEDGQHIVYHNYQDIGIAVGGGKGLVVPILRNVENMSFAEIEKRITDLAARAQENKINLEELQGGTFTISNGGVYGSLLSTPIVNPPQSGILGLHAIQDRPVAIDGEVHIRKMMYVALTYDHRIVDGREAVTFLRRIKECIEHPNRMLLGI